MVNTMTTNNSRNNLMAMLQLTNFVYSKDVIDDFVFSIVEDSIFDASNNTSNNVKILEAYDILHDKALPVDPSNRWVIDEWLFNRIKHLDGAEFCGVADYQIKKLRNDIVSITEECVDRY